MCTCCPNTVNCLARYPYSDDSSRKRGFSKIFCSDQCWNGCVPPPHMPILSWSAAATSVSRISCSCASSGSYDECTLELISIIDSAISGVTLPGKGLRFRRCSRSGLASIRLKSERLTSCSSSSTPKVCASDLAKASRGMVAPLRFARPQQGALDDDRAEDLQQHGHRGHRAQL